MKDLLIHTYLRMAGRLRASCYSRRGRNARCRGFTIIEILIVIAIIGTLAGIALPVGTVYIDKSRNTRAIEEVRLLETDIKAFEVDNGTLPNGLNDIDRGSLPDPWGNPYQYVKVEGTPQGQLRKDRFLVPVNSDYDLYSMGKDGLSQKPFTAARARDDIVRAADGGYVGLASEF